MREKLKPGVTQINVKTYKKTEQFGKTNNILVSDNIGVFHNFLQGGSIHLRTLKIRIDGSLKSFMLSPGNYLRLLRKSEIIIYKMGSNPLYYNTLQII